jgi:hypothetical protein
VRSLIASTLSTYSPTSILGAVAPQKALQKLDDHLLDQGDVLADVPFVRWRDGKPTFGSKGLGIITSHGCACEDYERALEAHRSSQAERVMLQVAPLKPAKVFGEKIEVIKSGTHLDLFYVQGEGSRLADQVVDLTREQGIPASVLAACKKCARIADWQWRALLVHVAVSRFHQQPEKLFLNEVLESRSASAA